MQTPFSRFFKVCRINFPPPRSKTALRFRSYPLEQVSSIFENSKLPKSAFPAVLHQSQHFSYQSYHQKFDHQIEASFFSRKIQSHIIHNCKPIGSKTNFTFIGLTHQWKRASASPYCRSISFGAKWQQIFIYHRCVKKLLSLSPFVSKLLEDKFCHTRQSSMPFSP